MGYVTAMEYVMKAEAVDGLRREFREIMERQQLQIDELKDRVEALQVDKEGLEEENKALTCRVELVEAALAQHKETTAAGLAKLTAEKATKSELKVELGKKADILL